MKRKKSGESCRRSKVIYGLCIAGMAGLVMAAFQLPQFVFMVQDKYRFMNTAVEERGSLDIARLNMTYEKQLSTRMENFARGNHEFVTATGYDTGDATEKDVLLNQIMAQDLNLWMADYNYLSEYFYYGYSDGFSSDDVSDWKKYVVYGEDIREGVTLMVWYVDITLADDTRMQLLTDTETGTLYYVRVTAGKSDAYRFSFDSDYPFYYPFDFLLPVSYYYESDVDQWLETGGDEQAAGNETVIYNYDKDIFSKNIFTDLVITRGDNEFSMSFPLYYGDQTLTFRFEAHRGNGFLPDYTMGISEIGNLIPEMMQD